MVMAFSIFGWIDNSSELKVTIELNLSWAFTITLETVVSSIMNSTSWPFEGDTSLNSKHFSSFCFVFAFVDSFCLFVFFYFSFHVRSVFVSFNVKNQRMNIQEAPEKAT